MPNRKPTGNPRGRPVGSKDSTPRKCESRATAMISEFKDMGITTPEVAQQNLEMIDYLIRKARTGLEDLEGKVDVSNLNDKDIVSYYRQMNNYEYRLYQLLNQRQSWFSKVAEYTDYKKGTEKIIETKEGDYKTAADLLKAPKNITPLIEG